MSVFTTHRPPQKGTFDSEDVGEIEREPQLDRIFPLHALKLCVIAYKKAQAEGSGLINK